MNRKTCRYGFIFVAAICLGLMVTSARGGSLDDTAAPTNPASAMYTLQDLYNRLNTGAAVAKRTGAFTEPTAGPTSGTMHTLDEIMTLANRLPMLNYPAPVPKTGQTQTGPDIWYPGDDGDLRLGVAWPNPRFTAGTGISSNCVTDNLTGLMWLRNPSDTALIWTQAVAYCESLDGTSGRGNYTDWRLPNLKELLSLIDYQYKSPAIPNTEGTGQCMPFGGYNAPFIIQPDTQYWSSSVRAWLYGWVWYMESNAGAVHMETMTHPFGVWPVRGGQ